MTRTPPCSTQQRTLFPYTTLFRSPPPSFVFHGLERGFLRRVSPRDPSGPGHPLGFPSSLRSTAGRSPPVRRSSRVREPRRRSHLRDRGEHLRPRAAAGGPRVVRRRRRGELCLRGVVQARLAEPPELPRSVRHDILWRTAGNRGGGKRRRRGGVGIA